MELDLPVSSVPLVGPHFAKRLQRLNIKTVKDLVYHFPHRYQDYTLTSPISSLQPGETVTIQGQVISIKNIYTRGGRKIQTAQVSDGTNSIGVTWFNQPFLVKTLPAGTTVSLSGKVNWFGKKKVLVSPEYEKISNIPSLAKRSGAGKYEISNIKTVHTGRLVPIYPETSGISSKWLRSRVAAVLPYATAKIEEFLPEQVKKQNNLVDIKTALGKVHFPENMEEADTARKRLAFDELFEMQLLALYRKKEWKKQKLAHRLYVDQEKILRFINNLPFELTESQKQACREILKDIGKEEPMNRLLEGDVGSGKTVVAALACFVAYINGYQSAVMAPTQILANQHFNTLNTLLGHFGIKVTILTGEKNRKQKIENRNSYDIIVGTHALLQKSVSFDNLVLIVIDEQHRFGVAQRAVLAEKGQGKAPHVLTMTATPIPRTIALTMYGDLELSTLDEMPKGRIEIKTWVVPPQKREAAYKWIKERVKETDEQAFIVCPLIEESEKETMKSVKAATAEFERLSKKVFPDLRLGLLHGRMKSQEKNEVMEKFKKGELDVLVATPVVEVGIDMPNATIMLVEAAERFGLAQLHQLRGRVGRGSKQSYCLLFTGSQSVHATTRLKALERTLSGAQLAELDLKMRGPGEIYGTMQHGFPELKIASFSDYDLIKRAREGAEDVIEKLDLYPNLQKLLKEKSSVSPN